MRHITLDLETFLASYTLPQPVCLSWCYDDHREVGVVGNNKLNNTTALEQKAHEIFDWCLENNYLMVWQNGAAFDLPVLWKHIPSLRDKILSVIDKELVRDTMIREKLLMLSTKGEIAQPKGFYGLEGLAKRYLGQDISKWKKGNDIWRLRYGELDGYEVSAYPDMAVEYAILDTDLTNQIYIEQESRRAPFGPGSLNTESLQIKSAFVLSLTTEEGIKVDIDKLKEFKENIENKLLPLKQWLIDNGYAYYDKREIFCKDNKKFIKYLEDNYSDYIKRLPVTKQEEIRAQNACKVWCNKEEKKDIRNWIKENWTEEATMTFEFPNERYPDIYIDGKWADKVFKLTSAWRYDNTLYQEPKGNIDISETALKEYPLDEVIQARLDISLLEKLNGTYCDNIQKAKGIFRSAYDVLKNTGRTSSFIQTFPRDLGIRELFCARRGKKICTIDIAGHEFITTGQVDIELGLGNSWSRYLNSGKSPPDPHALLGHKWHEYRTGERVTIEEFQRRKENGDEEIKKSRKEAKAPGLSFRGGGSNETISTISKGEISPQSVAQARAIFETLIPEQRLALGSKGWINKQKLTDNSRAAYAYSTNGRYRNYCTYSACANGKFMQSLAADSAKAALWQLFKDIWAQGWYDKIRIIFFIHDEIGFEIDEIGVDKAVLFLSESMTKGLAHYLPDMRIAVEGAVMNIWSKEKGHELQFRAWREPYDGRFIFEVTGDTRNNITLKSESRPSQSSPSS